MASSGPGATAPGANAPWVDAPPGPFLRPPLPAQARPTSLFRQFAPELFLLPLRTALRCEIGGIDILQPDADIYAAMDAPVNQSIMKVDPPQNEGDQLL